MSRLPLLLASKALAPRLGRPDLLVVDLGKEAIYRQAHVPGAIHVDHRRLLGEAPAPGALPAKEDLGTLLSGIGLAEHLHVVACDDEGGSRAARFLWILDVVGHDRYSLLDGGIHAWLADGLDFATDPSPPRPGNYPVTALKRDSWVEMDDLLARHRDPDVVIWDARSREEFMGTRALSRRAGRIPGAVHYEWTAALDEARELRLRDLDAVRAELAALGITADKEIVTHCQTHHRASFTWLLGRLLGFPRIRGYPGAWAEWSSHDDAPVAVGPVD